MERMMEVAQADEYDGMVLSRLVENCKWMGK